jgi:hypothetical protein
MGDEQPRHTKATFRTKKTEKPRDVRIRSHFSQNYQRYCIERHTVARTFSRRCAIVGLHKVLLLLLLGWLFSDGGLWVTLGSIYRHVGIRRPWQLLLLLRWKILWRRPWQFVHPSRRLVVSSF